MTHAVAQILSEVERLSPPERVELRRALVAFGGQHEDRAGDGVLPLGDPQRLGRGRRGRLELVVDAGDQRLERRAVGAAKEFEFDRAGH